MNALHQIALYAHIAIGAVALIVFWVPIAARKGSPLHRRAGRYFLWGMTAVAVSGIALSSMSFIDPVGTRYGAEIVEMGQAFQLAANVREFSLFLLMLSVLVYTTANHATLVLKARDDRSLLRTPGHVTAMVATGLLGLVTGAVGFSVLGQSGRAYLLLIFAVIGVNGSIRMLRYTFKSAIAPREWLLEHISFAVGSGIAAYTAFAAFGGRALFSEFLTGQWQLVPWILPTIIGTAYARRASRPYEPRAAVPA